MRSRFPRVEFDTIVPRRERPRVDAEERQVAVRVVDDLERVARRTAPCRRPSARSSLSLSGLIPLTGGMSSGDGR